VNELQPTNLTFLPYYYELIQDHKHNELAIPGGKGCGKTTVARFWHHNRSLAAPGGISWWLAPDYSLTRWIGLEGYIRFLESLGWIEGVHFEVNYSQMVLRYRVNGHSIFFKSANSKLHGENLTHITIDETGSCDENGIIDALDRVRDERGGKTQKLFLGAPQGLNHFYDRFSSPDMKVAGEFGQFRYNDRKLVLHYRTYWNPFLPEDYVPGQVDNYGNDELLIRAWICGEFVPLSQGNCYKFNQLIHADKPYGPAKDVEQLFLLWDFNVGQVAWVAAQLIANEWYAVAESPHDCRTTDDAMDDFIKQFSPFIYKSHEIIIDGDANGWAGDTRGLTNDYQIIQARLFSGGYTNVRLAAPRYNDEIQTRVIVTNRAFNQNRVHINNELGHLIRSFNGTTWDNHGKIAKGSGDLVSHKSDAFSYGISRHERIRAREEQIRMVEKHGRRKRLVRT